MDIITKAVKILMQGGIIIFPTDTAFGIGCRISSHKSITKLFQIRKRPLTQAPPILVDSKEMSLKYFRSPITDNVRLLMDKFWPGALTIVYNRGVNIDDPLILGEGEKVGIRMPNHKTTLNIIEKLGEPVLGPSANFHGEATPFTYNEINPELIRLVDFVIHGRCKIKKASTVVDCSSPEFKIIRQGAIHI